MQKRMVERKGKKDNVGKKEKKKGRMRRTLGREDE